MYSAQGMQAGTTVKFRESGGIAGCHWCPQGVEEVQGPPTRLWSMEHGGTQQIEPGTRAHVPESDDGIAPLQLGRAKPLRAGCMRWYHWRSLAFLRFLASFLPTPSPSDGWWPVCSLSGLSGLSEKR